jgi:hypothetical protein
VRPYFALAASTLLASSAGAQKGTWAHSFHVCTEAERCTEGVMTNNDAPVFVSKAECDDSAQELANSLREMGLVVKYVRCVQL